MAVNTRIQFRRGTATEWTNSANTLGQGILYQGELGFETNTGKFKIGNGTQHWTTLPYAGGSQIVAQTGVGYSSDTANNTYTLYSVVTGVTGGQDGITFQTFPLSGLLNDATVSGTYYRIGLSNKLENFHDLSSSGIVIQTGNNGFAVRSLSGIDNISITNANGTAGSPTIALNSNITGISSITGINNFRIASSSGITIDAGSGVVTVDDLKVDGYLQIGAGIDILLAARILAQGPIFFSGNPTVYSGSVYYNETPYVGPTGGTLGVNLLPVSLSGHQHSYLDIPNFCSGVASCVDTSLSAGTGVQLVYNSGTDNLSISLSGQSLAFHTLNSNGLVVRSAQDTVVARTITASGANIWIGDGNGVSNNPTVGLNPNVTVTSITTNDMTVVNNLTVNGTTVIANVETIVVEDPILTLGKSSGTIVANTSYDRGLALVVATGQTAFMGYDQSASKFVMLSSGVDTNSSGNYDAGTYGVLRVGTYESETATANTLAVFNSSKQLVSSGIASLVPSGRSITPGSGLDGTTALTLHQDITLNVGQGDGITVGSNTVAVDSTVVRTSSVQFITGVKSFADRPIFASGITTTGIVARITAAGSAGTHFPVFTSNPTSSAQTVGVRTTGELRSDLSINNVTNDAQVKKRASSTNGYVPTWNGTTGDSLNDGYQATSTNVNSTLVVRDGTNGGFTAGTITATGFIGYGGGLTGLYANNIASGTIPTGVLTGTYNISITGSAYSTTGSLTFKNDGTGDAANTAFSGLTSRTISYNSIGAPSTTGANASGSNWNISILGNAATVTNGVYTTGTQNISGIKTFFNTPIFNSGITSSGIFSVLAASASAPLGFAVFDAAPTGSSQSLVYRTLANVRSDLGASTNTASTLVLRDSNGDFASRYITVTGISGVQTVGSMTSVYTSTTISGINNTTYLANFIIDGGTP
jgi:hypothetical protein